MTKLLTALSIIALATAALAVPAVKQNVESNYQQAQALPRLQIQQGANMQLQYRIKSRDAWDDLTGLTARWDARSSATSTQALQVASSSTVSNSTPNYFVIDLDSTQTGSAVTNWVYALNVLSNGDDYVIGTGRVDIVESAWTGAAAVISNITIQVMIDASIATHAADEDAHHARYTDAEATNATTVAGFVKASVTNGLASTNWVQAQGYVTDALTVDASNLTYYTLTTDVDADNATQDATHDAHTNATLASGAHGGELDPVWAAVSNQVQGDIDAAESSITALQAITNRVIEVSPTYISWAPANTNMEPGDVLTSSLLTNGYAGISYSRSGSAAEQVELSTNAVDWALADYTNVACYIRIAVTNGAPDPSGTNIVALSNVEASSWTRPDLWQRVRDVAGQSLRVDDAVDEREPVPLSQLNTRIAAITPAGWANYPATADIAMGNNAITYGGNYMMGVDAAGDLVVYYVGQPMLSFVGGTDGLAITNLIVSTNEVTLHVATNGVERAPWPEYSESITSPAWTKITDYSSTYPTNVAGSYHLTFAAPTGTPIYVRARQAVEYGATIKVDGNLESDNLFALPEQIISVTNHAAVTNLVTIEYNTSNHVNFVEVGTTNTGATIAMQFAGWPANRTADLYFWLINTNSIATTWSGVDYWRDGATWTNTVPTLLGTDEIHIRHTRGKVFGTSLSGSEVPIW